MAEFSRLEAVISRVQGHPVLPSSSRIIVRLVTRLVVGRSWEENTNDGPKMINTIVGVHNGDYVRLLKQSNERVEQVEAGLNAMEEKVNRMYRPLSVQNHVLTRNKVK